MNMSSSRRLPISLTFDKSMLPMRDEDVISVTFVTRTITPQFNILALDTSSSQLHFPKRMLDSSGNLNKAELLLHAHYLGRALVRPTKVSFTDSITRKTSSEWTIRGGYELPVVIVQFEGIWGSIFVVSVVALIIISYINIGAQMDEDNMRHIINKPKTLILGFLITVLVMPSLSWFVGKWLFQEQLLYRIGSFIFAASPAASASTLWTFMLNSDKELAVCLMVVSTAGALVTLPSLLYFLDTAIHLEASHHVNKLPYMNLIMSLAVLTVALLIGWRFVGRNKQAREISARIFKPLVYFVLAFIIIFSTILYWHLYQMFDWNITLASAIITMVTLLISGLLGHLINGDLDRGVAIAISSTYKNSGIAFAILLVAFEPPDTYIAYVPCLTQIVITSLTLYLVYTIVSIISCIRRRGQPNPVRATSNEGDVEGSPRDKSDSVENEEESDEFIALNVTEIENALAGENRKQSGVAKEVA